MEGYQSGFTPGNQPATDNDDEAYVEGSSLSYTTSLASLVVNGVLENGRIYSQYGKHKYGLPVDEREVERLNLQHHKYEIVLGQDNYLAPIGPNPLHILDLGTGTGLWCIDIADKFPSAQVIGVDIAAIQPQVVPPNCQFEIEDIEEDWKRSKKFDYIHLRDPLFMIRDWHKLVTQAYNHLTPGGYLELASTHPTPMCDDGTMPEDSGFFQIYKKLIEASHFLGTPCDVAPKFKDYLAAHGFIDIREHIYTIPTTPWPKSQYLKSIARVELLNATSGIQALTMRPFTQAFGWTRNEVELALVDFRRDVKNSKYHQYTYFIVAYGRKPPWAAAT